MTGSKTNDTKSKSDKKHKKKNASASKKSKNNNTDVNTHNSDGNETTHTSDVEDHASTTVDDAVDNTADDAVDNTVDDAVDNQDNVETVDNTHVETVTSDCEDSELVPVSQDSHNSDEEDNSESVIGLNTFKELIEQLTSTKKTLASLTLKLKELEKWTKKNEKSRKKKVKDPNRKPNTSGINKPYPVPELTSELKEFMGFDDGEMISRVDVLRFVCNYVKEKDLQNPSNKKEILPDDELTKVFPDVVDMGLTYTTIMKHVTKHFPSSKSSQ
jgi:chromatin remodeling complex protein RSC6